MMKSSGQKGVDAEEALRGYFRSIGYFVLRGVPFVYKRNDITDVDLWLYVKATPLAAERSCVDVKRRKTPQAMERVLWTRGLKEVLGVERAIVVTSDNRLETREFGATNGVEILQGALLQYVINTHTGRDRLTEEELFEILKQGCIIDPRVDWRAWFRRAKSRLLDSLDFDGCNSFLLSIKFLLNEYVATGRTSEVSVRLLYLIIAYLLICLDYTSRSCVSLDLEGRVLALTDGFRYGEAGRNRTEEIVKMAMQLLAEAGKADLTLRDTLRHEFDKQVLEYRAEILGEHFAKTESLLNLFPTARLFEDMAYAKTLTSPNGAPPEQKAIIGLLCDFLQHDRKGIL